MTIEYTQTMPGFSDVEICADGTVSFLERDYYGREVSSKEYTLDELQTILTMAAQHQTAYDVYKRADFADEEYILTMQSLLTSAQK